MAHPKAARSTTGVAQGFSPARETSSPEGLRYEPSLDGTRRLSNISLACSPCSIKPSRVRKGEGPVIGILRRSRRRVTSEPADSHKHPGGGEQAERDEADGE